MSDSVQRLLSHPVLRRQMLGRVILWTLAISAFVGIGLFYSSRGNRDTALTQARGDFQKEMVISLLVPRPGGGYTLANEDVANPASVEATGNGARRMGLPPSMARIAHEQGIEGSVTHGRMISLAPLRPENGADAWEQKALRSIGPGRKEFWEEVTFQGRPQLRYVGGLVVQQGCLRCHAEQGYKAGEIKGGISFAVPLERNLGLAGRFQNLVPIWGLVIVWGVGLLAILAAAKWHLKKDAERSEADAAIRASEEQLRVIFETSEAGIIMVSPDGVIMFANQHMAEMVGTTIAELIGTSYVSHLSETEKEVGCERLRQCLDGEIEVIFWERSYVRVDGTVFTGHISGRRLCNPDGSPRAMVGVITDITGRKVAEAKLRNVMLAVEQSPVSIVITDRTGNIEYANPYFSKISGYPWHEVVGRNPRILKSGEVSGETYHDLWSTITGGFVWEGDLHNKRKDGTIFIEHAKIAPITGDGGEITGFVGVKEDITEQRRNEEERVSLLSQLTQLQKMESIGSLAGGVAHDMNNVLGAILGIASAHAEKFDESDSTRRAFETIAKASLRGRDVTKGLLSFARKDTLNRVPIDLNAMAMEVVQLLSATTLKKVQVVPELQPLLPTIHGEPGAIRNALMNLCVNAVDAMAATPNGGKIIITTRVTPGGNTGGMVEISVNDSGCGMPPEVLRRAMDPFYTTKGVGKGTGLGLSIVYGTMKAHGGSVAIESEVFVGTVITLSFPVAVEETKAHEALGDAKHSASVLGLKILVVDDDPLMRESLSDVIVVLGHVPLLEAGGLAALARLETGYSPDVMILDMNMPGMNGVETLWQVLALRPKQKVILCSGHPSEDAARIRANNPRVHILGKPFRIDELRERLEDLHNLQDEVVE